MPHHTHFPLIMVVVPGRDKPNQYKKQTISFNTPALFHRGERLCT